MQPHWVHRRCALSTAESPGCHYVQVILVCCMGGQRSRPRWADQPSSHSSSSSTAPTTLLHPGLPQRKDMCSRLTLVGRFPRTPVLALPQVMRVWS